MKSLFTFLAALLISNALIAQIPNPGFENWTTVGSYMIPNGWDNADSATNALGVHTCQQGSPGFAGNHYVKLISTTLPLVGGVAPGIAVSGKINFTTLQPQSGFAFTLRPANLTGEWQYAPATGDTGNIIVFMSKWNTATSLRDTVAFVDYKLPGSVTSWTAFSIPLVYKSGGYPDSAVIVLSSSNSSPVNGSYLYVDTLLFTGSVPLGVTSVANTAGFVVYPNPATSATTISYNCASATTIRISVNDMSGRNITTLTPKTVTGENKFTLNTADFAKGIYIIKIIDGANSQVQKLVIE